MPEEAPSPEVENVLRDTAKQFFQNTLALCIFVSKSKQVTMEKDEHRQGAQQIIDRLEQLLEDFEKEHKDDE